METRKVSESTAQPLQATPGLLPAPAGGSSPFPHAGLGLARGGPKPGWPRGGRGVTEGECYVDFLFKAVLSWPALTLFYFPRLEQLLGFFFFPL